MIERLLGAAAPVLLTLGLVSAAEVLATVEWSSVYCSLSDGPLSAIFGFPLPYLRWSLASSLQYLVLPHVYLVNLLVLFLLFYPLVRRVTHHRVVSRRRAWLAAVGLGLCTVVAAWRCFLLASSFWQPARSIAIPPDDAYLQYRPVGISFDAHYDCTPSEFCFGER